MMSSWLWTPLTQRVSSMYNRMRNTVDSPSGDPENEPELANETEETTEGRGATTGAPTWGTDRVVTTQPVGDAHLAALATVTGTMPEVAQRQQQSPSIIVQDSPRTLNLFDSVAHSPVTHPQPLTQLRNCIRRRRQLLCAGVDLLNDATHLNVVVLLRGAAVRRCAVITASDRNSSMVRAPSSHSGRILRTAQRTTSGRKLTSWRISRHR